MVIGIDLGTTNSIAAVFRADGPELIPNALGEYLTPSAVHINKSGVAVIGAPAKDHLVSKPNTTTSNFKRLMGTGHQTQLGKKSLSPEDLSALVLKALKEDAEAFLGEPVSDAVISVPAYFNDVQRKATITAAGLAGLNVKRLINEPTAAALAYGLHDKEGEDTFLVVDLGGGTFDVSILEMFSGVMEVRSSAGDAFLGGEDFTTKIVAHFASLIGEKVDAMAPGDLSRLRAVADQAKHDLSTEAATTVHYRQGEKEIALPLSRNTFEELVTDLIARMKTPLQRAISDAGLRVAEIDRIVLVGGATRMPPVHNLITRLFKRFPEFELNPDTVVALGAAVQAGLVARDAALDDMVMTDVCPFTLGYEISQKDHMTGRIENGLFQPLIERNTTIPVSRSHVVQSAELMQTRITVNVFQGEAPYVRDNVPIGTYNIPIPMNRTEHEEVEIRFTYDVSGVLEVITTVLSTQKSETLIIENTPGALSRTEIEKRFKELEKIKIHPRDEAENEALIAKISAAYENALGDRRAALSNLLVSFEHTLQSHDKRAIANARKDVTDALQDLIAANVFD